MQISSVTPLLNVENVARSIEFYRSQFGFEVTQEWERDGRVRWAALETSGIRLMLNESHDVDSRERHGRRTYADVVLYFAVGDVGALHAQLHRGGIAVSALADEHYGMREFYVRDPDGYELGFGTPLAELKAAT